MSSIPMIHDALDNARAKLNGIAEDNQAIDDALTSVQAKLNCIADDLDLTYRDLYGVAFNLRSENPKAAADIEDLTDHVESCTGELRNLLRQST